MEALQNLLEILAVELKEAEDKMTKQGMEPFTSGDQVVRFFDGNA